MNKRIQKQFYISSEVRKQLIETRIDEIVSETRQSSSTVIEDILLDALLPRHKEAKRIVEKYLYSSQANGIMITLRELFILNELGMDWEAKYDNFKPIVEFYAKVSSRKCVRIDEDDQDDLLYHLQDLITKISEAITYCIETYDRGFYMKYVKEAQHILSLAEKEKGSRIRISDFVNVILSCWSIIGKWAQTYKCLAFFANIDKCDDNPQFRHELFKLIDSISTEWDRDVQVSEAFESDLSFSTSTVTPIQFRYHDSKQYAEKSIEVYANEALVGILSPVLPNSDWLIWMPDLHNTHVKFQFRQPASFIAVVQELQRFKTQHGYKYLVIYAYNHGFVSEIDSKLLSFVGFKRIPETDPTSLFLE